MGGLPTSSDALVVDPRVFRRRYRDHHGIRVREGRSQITEGGDAAPRLYELGFALGPRVDKRDSGDCWDLLENAYVSGTRISTAAHTYPH